MSAYFFDSSALVKCYIVESGTTWARAIAADQDNVVHVSSLTRVEIISALTRRFRRGDIAQAEFDLAHIESQLDIANQYEVVGFSDRVIEEAVRLARKHGLRAYDALQLSTVIDVRRILAEVESITLTLVTADLELNAAAVAEGFSTEDPNNH